MKITRNNAPHSVQLADLQAGKVYRNEDYLDEAEGFFMYTDEDGIVYLDDGTAYPDAESTLGGQSISGPYDAELVIR